MAARKKAELLELVKRGDLETLQRLEPGVLVGTGKEGAFDKYGCKCIHWAAGNGHLAVLRWLVHTGADPSDVCAGSLRQPAHYAARNGHLPCLRYLLEGEPGNPIIPFTSATSTTSASSTRPESAPTPTTPTTPTTTPTSTTTTAPTSPFPCDLNALAKHAVSPFQLAVWQNQIEVAQWLCSHPQVMADPRQVNEFDCGSLHWLGTAPTSAAGNRGEALLPMAQWLLDKGCDVRGVQRSGHTVLHKAAWGNHSLLCRWLHLHCGMWDDTQDRAGNYAADVATMGKHHTLAGWLRGSCSR
ncbi:ankyrin repeat-containing domain protein [Ochromonadaceae sp. CCMP2298]|nr:ankyrin repeat-containing domain protein [Ochromonadaceae sp. CCMP2298]